MACQIIWSEQARDDLQAIVLFIAQDNPSVAESFGFQLMSKVDVLAQFPQIGRVVPEENDEIIRKIILRPYRIIAKFLRKNNWLPLPASGMARAANRKSRRN